MIRFIQICLLAVGSALFPISNLAAESASEAIQKANREFEEAFAKGDTAIIAAQYTEDAEAYRSGEGLFRGKADIEAGWKKDIGEGGRTATAHTVGVEEKGDYASELGKFTIEKDGEIEYSGHYILLWKRENGAWKIHREMGVADAMADAGGHATEGSAQEDLLSAMRKYDELSAKQDVNAAKDLLAEDFTLVLPDGKVMNKQGWIDNARSGKLKYTVAKSETSNPRLYGDTGIVTGRWHEAGTYDGESFDQTLQYTTTYQKRDGKWQVLADHVTKIEE